MSSVPEHHRLFERPYSRAEIISDGAVHIVGLVAALIGLTALVMLTARWRGMVEVSAVVIYGVALVTMLGCSLAYNMMPISPLKWLLRRFDHCGIYLLIAGTYTPFTLGVLRGPWGWSLFTAIWVLAVLGVIAKNTVGFRYPRLSTLMYVGMGWAALIAVKPLAAALTDWQLGWLFAGGVAYTLGVPFYVWKARRYTHAVWHAFVLAGVACHFVAVLSVIDGAG